MNLFNPLLSRIDSWKQNHSKTLSISGLDSSLWSFINYLSLVSKSELTKNNNLLIFPTSDEAENFYHAAKKIFRQDFSSSINFLHFPGLDASPYSGIVSSEKSLFFRLRVLNTLLTSQKINFVVTSLEATTLKLPPIDFFKETSFEINKDDIISPSDLSKKLVASGYSSSHSVEEPGTFIKKGEIFDLYPISHPAIRIHYFDDLIEAIFLIDKETGRTIKDSEVNSVTIAACPGVLCQSKYSNNLREKLIRPTPGQKIKHETRKDLFQKLTDGMLFENYPSFVPLFFDKNSTLLDFFDKDKAIITLFNNDDIDDKLTEHKETLRVDYDDYIQGDYALLPPCEYLYDLDFYNNIHDYHKLQISNLKIHKHFDEEEGAIELNLETAKNYFLKHTNIGSTKQELLKNVLTFIKGEFSLTGNIIFTIQNDNSKNEILHILDMLNFPGDLKNRISFIYYKLSHGFFHEAQKTLVIADSDLFSIKQEKIKIKNTNNYDLFAEQLASLTPGDYVIHSKHGIGQYLGLEPMEVGGSVSDFITLSFKDGDKVFVPIYKMNLIQKYADSQASLTLDSLRTNKFSATKARAKESVKKLAFDLLRLQAERQSSPAFAFSPPDHNFTEFELDFPFSETPDQRSAIDAILDKMELPAPMDFLVCGDVGFGKTEVAMRAAYKAVLDKKQVAVLVPTTVLAFQHFNSFVKRFKNFAVNIDYLSRFKSAKEEKETKEKLKSGEIDIIIGTHKLISDSIKFKDLGLVIVDEEQRFGVAHKSKFQIMKTTVDFLTLTATPIPRTLQLSFLGLKDLALIKTAPPRRQSIKTYLIKEDDHTLQSAIQRELKRGGQVFIVHNRVSDMENYVAYIRELVPEATIVYAHGQLPEKELEERVAAFYKGHYQILVSTTIIESGIDIPNANTMIVDRADMYGLSQLHQLRGRIGRSDKKAYAYFVIPTNKPINEIAEKRLKALLTYADMGSGFQIANCDLEIRGAGDILGAQQSGHIEAIGLELYMELLTEAINELRGEKRLIHKDIEINTPFACFIPASFIADASDRLKYYKQLSNAKTTNDLTTLEESIFDIYGPMPVELNNLFAILNARIHLQPLAIKSVQVIDANIVLTFEKSLLDQNEQLRNAIIDAFISRTKKYKFTPDFKLIYGHKEKVSPTYLVDFCKEIAEQIVPC